MIKIIDMKTYLLCAALTVLIYGSVFTLLTNFGAGVDAMIASAIPLTLMVVIINMAILERYNKL